MSTPAEQFDLIIVGSGSGNHIPSFLDTWNIAIVERGTFGGTCLNKGCIPSKMFVLPADRVVEANEAAALGVDLSLDATHWAAIRDRIFGRIDPIAESGRIYRAEGCPNITLIEGTAQFIESAVDGLHSLDVDGRVISAPHVLLAVGGRPIIPSIPGIDDVRYHTSDSIMRLDALPPRLGIIGGGFIAAEMGHVFSSLGSKVTLFNRSAGLLSNHDDDIAELFTAEFGRRVDLHLGELPISTHRSDDGISLDGPSGSVTVDELLVACGRQPNSDLVRADVANLAVHDDGRIAVDDYMRTSIPGIWAIGDVANDAQLKHVANAEVDAAFWNIAHPHDVRTVRQRAVPFAVFSHPQIAAVGLTERTAISQGLQFSVGRRDYAGTAYGWALGDVPGFAKVLVERETGLILGAHIIGPQAATLIQPLVQAMQFGQTAEALARDVYYIHPALTEVVENALLDALESAH